MSGNAAAAEILTLTANGNGTGIPPDILSALIDSHVSRLQGDLCMILLSGICYGTSFLLCPALKLTRWDTGVTLQYVVAYFTHYWRGRPESGIRRDSLGMRVYVVVLCTVATAYLCVIIASAWGHGTLSVMYAGIVDPDVRFFFFLPLLLNSGSRLTPCSLAADSAASRRVRSFPFPSLLRDADDLEIHSWWLLCALFILLNGYWVFARCYKVRLPAVSAFMAKERERDEANFLSCGQVTKSALLRILGAVLFGASAASLIAVAILYLKLKLDSTISFDDLDICVAVGLWLALALDIFCALVLCYELVYKRRKSLAKSSLVQQFLVVALQSSLLTGLSFFLPFALPFLQLTLSSFAQRLPTSLVP